MPCQPMESVKVPPMMGATTGATPLTAPISASIRARSRPPKRSVATDREMTMPPEPAMPCRKRAAMNWRMSEAKMQSSVEPMKSHMAVSSGVRRPYLSLRGPKSSCPAARPIMLVVSPICTIDEEVRKKSVMAGSVGRYMSVTKGPNAVSRPSRTSRKSLLLSLFIMYCLTVAKLLRIFALQIAFWGRVWFNFGICLSEKSPLPASENRG